MDTEASVAGLQAQLNDVVAKLQGQAPATPGPAAAPGLQAWAGAAPAVGTSIIGVSVPIKVQTPIGSVRVYLSLPAEAAASLQALEAAIGQLAQAGLPVDAWVPRQPQQGGGGYGNNYRGGGGRW